MPGPPPDMPITNRAPGLQAVQPTPPQPPDPTQLMGLLGQLGDAVSQQGGPKTPIEAALMKIMGMMSGGAPTGGGPPPGPPPAQ